ncbi:MAG TPA: hypothetical protein VMZ91_05290 [Candidatus Paceibacterota bacterium]|nr:hypothetical protein [Candidatus Paceibacterota bacterium]
MKNMTSEVHNTIMDCLYDVPPKNITEAVIVDGITKKFGFNPVKIEKNKEKIISFLEELPETFFEDTGGGWSFLNACVDKNGELWGEQRAVEELVCLGIAIEKVSFLFPRDVWKTLPGGVPYFVIKH